MSTVYFISSNRAGADEHEANTETLSPTEERAHVVLSKPRRMLLHFSSQNLQSPPRGLHYLNAFGWGKEKFVQSATLALAAQHSHPKPFFLLLTSCHVLGGRVLTPVCCFRQGSAGPTVEHVGTLQCTPCLWLKACTATSPVFWWSFSSLILLEPSGASHYYALKTRTACFVEHSQRRVRLHPSVSSWYFVFQSP